MMRSLFSGVSGLKNHQTRMDVIGNNIANVNTTGFKSSRVTFTDMLSQNLSGASSPQGNIGGTNPKQVGLGSALGAIDLIFTNGNVQSTGVNTDLCLSSTNALFILDTGSGTAYTRNGAFQFDADGNYVQTGTGYYVQGWMARDGVIDTGAMVTNITIPSGKPMAPVASTMARYSNNLNAEVPTIVKLVGEGVKWKATAPQPTLPATATQQNPLLIKTANNPQGVLVYDDTYNVNDFYPTGSSDPNDQITDVQQMELDSATANSAQPITITLSDGSIVTQTSGTYEFGHSLPIVTTLAVYDALGSVHEIPVYFTLTDAATDTWMVSLTADGTTQCTIPEADGSTTTVEMKGSQTLSFNTNGSFKEGGTPLELTLLNGATSPQTIQLDLSALTQYSASSTIAGSANGNAAGILASISIDKTGTITGTYTNGIKQVEAQVALQRFTNPGGLNKIGESLYEDSNNAGKSGEPNTAVALGATITPSALEMSNVDVANEFTDMIITQRGFQSNSKIITVSDEMLETLINMKR